MKKIMFILLALFLSTLFLSAQNMNFENSSRVVNIGIGLGSPLYSGTFYQSNIPPVSVSFEQGIIDNILEKGVVGIGGYLGYTAYKWDYLNSGYKYANIIIGPRGSLHYPLIDKFDTYAGLFIGYNIVSSKKFGNAIGVPSSSHLIYSLYLGGRYYFTDKIAGMVELGSGITYLNLGIGIKLL